MSFASNLQTVALRLLQTYGTALTFSRVPTGTYNPTTGSIANQTITTYTGYGQPMSYLQFRDYYQDTEKAKSGHIDKDMRLLLYSTTKPLINDFVTIDSVVYRVQKVKKELVQGIIIIYCLDLSI